VRERRVVITGLGALSGCGGSVDDLWDAALAGRSAEARIQLDDGTDVVGVVVPELDADGLFGRREARRMDRAGQLASAAVGQALRDAGEVALEPDRIGAAIGTAHGGVGTLDAAYSTHSARGPDRVSALTVPLGLANSPATAAARTHQLRGPVVAPASACAAGADAIGLAAMHIRSGSAEAMVTGGAEAPMSPVIIAGYRKSGALTPGTNRVGTCSRPFDVARDGFVIAEGAGAVLLEERERALSRGARIYCELVGYGASCDANHLTDPEPSGAGPSRAVLAALAAAQVSAEDVGYVNAHATSTPAGDSAELSALGRAGLVDAAISSTKGTTGHALGAAGGLELIITARALYEHRLPPTANLAEPEPSEARILSEPVDDPEVEIALSTSFGFGGQNACLVLSSRGRSPG
jgi:3-oxoacyl-[acyl-carrier-protein] synthase II